MRQLIINIIEIIILRDYRVLMEKNTLVEFFANLVYNFVDTYEFNSFKGVSSNGRRIINLDKNSTLVRIKKVRSSNSYN